MCLLLHLHLRHFRNLSRRISILLLFHLGHLGHLLLDPLCLLPFPRRLAITAMPISSAAAPVEHLAQRLSVDFDGHLRLDDDLASIWICGNRRRRVCSRVCTATCGETGSEGI